MHFPGDDAEGLVIEEELSVINAEGVLGWGLYYCGKSEEGGEDKGGKKLDGFSHGMEVAGGEAGRDSFRTGARLGLKTNRTTSLSDELIISYRG
jgi:hypothetical protein